MNPRRGVLLLVGIASIVTGEAYAAGKGDAVFAVAGGLSRSDAENAEDLSWGFAGSVERMLSERHFVEVRGTLGLTGLNSADGPDGNCGFVKADFLVGSFLAVGAGVGLYHLHTPFNSAENRTVDWGINGGIRFGLPYHEKHLIFAEVTAHRIFADEPTVMVTLMGGFTWY